MSWRLPDAASLSFFFTSSTSLSFLSRRQIKYIELDFLTIHGPSSSHPWKVISSAAIITQSSLNRVNCNDLSPPGGIPSSLYGESCCGSIYPRLGRSLSVSSCQWTIGWLCRDWRKACFRIIKTLVPVKNSSELMGGWSKGPVRSKITHDRYGSSGSWDRLVKDKLPHSSSWQNFWSLCVRKDENFQIGRLLTNSMINERLQASCINFTESRTILLSHNQKKILFQIVRKQISFEN